MTCIIHNGYNVVLHSRFRHYYQHILTFRWLHPRQPDAPTGLILASTFGLQVAAHLALDHNNHEAASQIEDMEDVVVVNANATDSTLEKIERNPSRTTTQTSSVTSSITSRRKILTLGNSHAPDPDIIITSQLEEAELLTPVSEPVQPVKDNLVPALSPILSQQSEVRN